VDAFLVMACVYALLLWWHWRYLDTARAITGCRHPSGTMKVGVTHERTGKPTAMYWECNDCPLQMHFPRLLRLPNGTWWLLDEDPLSSTCAPMGGEPHEHPDDPEVGQGSEGGVHPEA